MFFANSDGITSSRFITFPSDLETITWVTTIISPKTIEALICHVADEADSKMNYEVLNAARYLVKEATGETWDKMDSKTAFRVLMLKAEGGWGGLKENIGLIKPK
jgi:hypothetical protein